MTRDQLIIEMFRYSGDKNQNFSTMNLIIQFITERCKTGNFQEIEDLFEHVSTDCTPTLYLVTMLRCSFTVYTSISNWKQLRDQSIESSIQRGENAASKFAGLMDADGIDDYRPSDFIKHLLGTATKK
jgi:hypothetical protein